MAASWRCSCHTTVPEHQARLERVPDWRIHPCYIDQLREDFKCYKCMCLCCKEGVTPDANYHFCIQCGDGGDDLILCATCPATLHKSCTTMLSSNFDQCSSCLAVTPPTEVAQRWKHKHPPTSWHFIDGVWYAYGHSKSKARGPGSKGMFNASGRIFYGSMAGLMATSSN